MVYLLVIPAVGRLEADIRGSLELASQLVKVQDNKRPCLKKVDIP